MAELNSPFPSYRDENRNRRGGGCVSAHVRQSSIILFRTVLISAPISDASAASNSLMICPQGRLLSSDEFSKAGLPKNAMKRITECEGLLCA